MYDILFSKGEDVRKRHLNAPLSTKTKTDRKLTRVELTDKRDQLDLAITGRDLLEDRLGALLSAFMQVAQEILRAREDLIDLSP